METIRYLLSKLLSSIVILIILIFIFIAVKKFFPGFSLGGATSFFTDNFLPDPVNLQSLGNGSIADLSKNIYQGERSPHVSYVEYTGTDMRIIPPRGQSISNGTGGTQVPTPSTIGTYVRNVTLYKGGSLYTRISFTGEAKEAFFKQGVFPVYIVDGAGRLLAQEQAVATPIWTFPGWTRFSVTVQTTLPSQVPCAVIFHAAQGSTLGNTQESMPMICNWK